MSPIIINPEGDRQSVTIHEAVITTFKQGRGGGRPMGSTTQGPSPRYAKQYEPLTTYLREFRQANRKDEMIGRGYLIDTLIEKHPEISKISTHLLRRQITEILSECGVMRMKKASSSHQCYFWPLEVYP